MSDTNEVMQFTVQIPAMLVLTISANKKTLEQSDVDALIKRYFDIEGTSISSVIDGHQAQLELSPDAFHVTDSEVIEDEPDVYQCTACGETVATEFTEFHDSNECERTMADAWPCQCAGDCPHHADGDCQNPATRELVTNENQAFCLPCETFCTTERPGTVNEYRDIPAAYMVGKRTK